MACTHFGSMGLSQGLLVGRKKGRIRTPLLSCLTWLLCSRIQVRTCLLTCQEALSQISSQQVLPCACSRVQHHSRNWVVMALTGRPVTKRSDIFLRRGSLGGPCKKMSLRFVTGRPVSAITTQF